MTISDSIQPANVLITGGSEGIGRALAARYLAAGSKVLITGRAAQKLEKAQREMPGILTFVNDISSLEEREALARHVESYLPGVNVVINNAGIQRRVSLASDTAEWPERQAEIDILLSAPVHLNHLLIPIMLRSKKPGMIVNVTSGGAFVPQVFAPVYSACKAALHSYTVTLRHALNGTSLRVVELVPPAVQTGLAGPGATHGAALDDFSNAVLERLQRGDSDVIGFGPTDTPEFRHMLDIAGPFFVASAGRFPVATYSRGADSQGVAGKR
jgi:uncharacterized oxidoreductase